MSDRTDFLLGLITLHLSILVIDSVSTATNEIFKDSSFFIAYATWIVLIIYGSVFIARRIYRFVLPEKSGDEKDNDIE